MNAEIITMSGLADILAFDSPVIIKMFHLPLKTDGLLFLSLKHILTFKDWLKEWNIPAYFVSLQK